MQLYIYNYISYKTVPIRNFRLMGNNVNFCKVEVAYWQPTPWLICFVYKNTTQNAPWIRGTTSSI